MRSRGSRLLYMMLGGMNKEDYREGIKCSLKDKMQGAKQWLSMIEVNVIRAAINSVREE